ncbi:putative cilium assembly protein [Trypoxylus dichotomus]
MKAHLRAENEELQIQLSDIRMSLETFERVIVKGAVSKVTQKIPAEKFVRYMQDWLKSAQYLLEKLRLRSLAFKTQLKKLKSSILHKQDLCRHVDIADFNVMQIEKEHLIEKLKQKNQNLIELKQMTTKGNSLLLVNKEILKKQCEALNMIKEMTDSAKKKVQVLMQEAAVTEQEVKRLRVKYKRLRTLANSYNTPSTIEYIKKKAELRELLKELKAIRRRDRLADISLVTYTKMMCKITGASEPEDSWYRLKTDASILEQLSNTDLPHLESCDSIISELDI